MAIQTKYKHGMFSWIELATSDADAGKRFYGALFGWTFDDRPVAPGMTYSMAKLGQHDVGAIYAMGAEMRSAKVPPHWASYVTVDSVDETAKKAAANGGTIVKEPFDVMDVGRMAVINDPTGASFCLWQAKKHLGAGVKNEPGALCWNELMTSNAATAGAFYEKTLGWQSQAIDMGPSGTYTLFKIPGEADAVAGMMQIGKDMKGMPSHWQAYIEVVDVDASTKRANELGAKPFVPPTDIPGIGRFSIVQDPTGATIALYKQSQ